MDHVARLEAPHPPEVVFPWVEELGRYPEWLDIVVRALPDPPGGDGSAGEQPAWVVDLRGRLGPLARIKRLRMARTVHRPPTSVRFERRERDGRSHADWVLSADLSPTAEGCTLTVHLHYGGALFGPVVQRALGDEIERSRSHLLRRIAGEPPGSNHPR